MASNDGPLIRKLEALAVTLGSGGARFDTLEAGHETVSNFLYQRLIEAGFAPRDGEREARNAFFDALNARQVVITSRMNATSVNVRFLEAGTGSFSIMYAARCCFPQFAQAIATWDA